MKYKSTEDREQMFARVILQAANQERITIRELEGACEMAIRYSRGALVPTPECPQTTQEN